jgi:hypothetical protein
LFTKHPANMRCRTHHCEKPLPALLEGPPAHTKTTSSPRG